MMGCDPFDDNAFPYGLDDYYRPDGTDGTDHDTYPSPDDSYPPNEPPDEPSKYGPEPPVNASLFTQICEAHAPKLLLKRLVSPYIDPPYLFGLELKYFNGELTAMQYCTAKMTEKDPRFMKAAEAFFTPEDFKRFVEQTTLRR